MLTSPHLHIARHGIQTAHIVGLPISDFSRYIIKQLAAEAHLQIVHITSVRRTVVDQARIFYNKHIVEGKVTKYKNPDVAKIVAHARELHAKGQAAEVIKIYLISSIEHIHGGPSSVSTHLEVSPFSEVFDVAHYSGPTTGAARHNYMTDKQARDSLRRVEKRCLIRLRGWVTHQSWDLSCPPSFTMRNVSISKSSSQFSTSSNRPLEQWLSRVARPLRGLYS